MSDYYTQSLQDLNETRTARLNSIWSYAAQLEKSTLAKCIEGLDFLASEIPRNNPSLDSIMFIRHNAPPWHEPSDFIFEPSPVWHDDAHMVVDDTAKVFLRNLMGKSKAQIGELKREVDKKRREVESLQRIKAGVGEGKDKRDEVEIVTAILSMQDELHRIDHKRLAAEVETSTIRSAVGDVTLGARNHNFKSQSFKIPTNCDLCGERIWGLSAKGFECKDCGYTCHSKCEMKVPATCPGEQSKEEKKKLKAERQEASHAVSHHTSNGGLLEGVVEAPALSRSNTMNSLSSGYATNAHRSVVRPALPSAPEEANNKTSPVKAVATKLSTTRRNRVIAPPPNKYVSELPANEVPARVSTPTSSSQQVGKMMYAYEANGGGEITVQEGDDVIILEPDGTWLCISEYIRTVTLIHPRWFRLDKDPGRRTGRYSPRELCRDLPASANHIPTARFNLLKLLGVCSRQYHGADEEERSGRRTKEGSEEVTLRRGHV